ncbi:hypothetical protein VZT92_019564 [Zoarces viviparus]|uniref:Uncharacterized protein n=1 Tax=Zoarces viviparus TaxID=48416 RepID=A0AAW1EMA4_ZOAVI
MLSGDPGRVSQGKRVSGGSPDSKMMNSSPQTSASSARPGKPGHPPGARPRRGARQRWPGLRPGGSAGRNNMEQPPCGPISLRDKHRGRVQCRPGGGPGPGPV